MNLAKIDGERARTSDKSGSSKRSARHTMGSKSFRGKKLLQFDRCVEASSKLSRHGSYSKLSQVAKSNSKKHAASQHAREESRLAGLIEPITHPSSKLSSTPNHGSRVFDGWNRAGLEVLEPSQLQNER